MSPGCLGFACTLPVWSDSSIHRVLSSMAGCSAAIGADIIACVHRMPLVRQQISLWAGLIGIGSPFAFGEPALHALTAHQFPRFSKVQKSLGQGKSQNLMQVRGYKTHLLAAYWASMLADARIIACVPMSTACQRCAAIIACSAAGQKSARAFKDGQGSAKCAQQAPCAAVRSVQPLDIF